MDPVGSGTTDEEWKKLVGDSSSPPQASSGSSSPSPSSKDQETQKEKDEQERWDVRSWLTVIGYGYLADCFVSKNYTTLHAVQNLDKDDLNELEINDRPTRKALKSASSELLANSPTPVTPAIPNNSVRVDLNSVTSVLNYLLSLQKKPLFCPKASIHDETFMFKLQGREKSDKVAVEVLKRAKTYLATGTSDTPSTSDRVLYPMPVFVGMPGLGKTRMLEEWERLFQLAGIGDAAGNIAHKEKGKEKEKDEKKEKGGKRLGVIVSYGNGTNVEEFERTMPIQASFSWRLLYELFLKDNFNDDSAQCWPRILPLGSEALTLSVAIEVILAGAMEFGHIAEGGELSLFVGIDEYQFIPNGPYFKEEGDPLEQRKQLFLWLLLNSLHNSRSTVHQTARLSLFPALAGTQIDIILGNTSSTVELKPVPLSLLLASEVEDTIISSSHSSLLGNLEFRRNLVALGGLPRPTIEYVKTQDFRGVWSQYVNHKWQLSDNELLVLVANAVSGIRINPQNESGILSLSWQNLFDRGLCLFDDDHLVIPYSIFKLASDIATDNRSLAQTCLIQNLRYLVCQIDPALFVLAQWQLWEKFGAVCFALRVNARCLNSSSDSPTCKFSDLIPGARKSKEWTERVVNLAPMEVHEIHEKFEDLELDSPSPKKPHCRASNHELNWLAGDDRGVRFCLVNGDCGKGLDFFSSFSLENSSEVLIYADQRKRVAKSNPGASKLLEDLWDILPSRYLCVAGVFSLLATFEEDPQEFPSDSFVVTSLDLKTFYGTLSSHYACSSNVDVNFSNESTICLLKSVSSIAKKIVQQARVEPFQNEEHLCNFCETQGREISRFDLMRVVGYSHSSSPSFSSSSSSSSSKPSLKRKAETQNVEPSEKKRRTEKGGREGKKERGD